MFGQTFTFNTGEDRSADTGIIPTTHPCLQPVLNGKLAAISPACRAALTTIRNSLQPGAGAQFINVEPWLDGDRKMGYLWGYSLGLKHEVMANLAASIDWIGNRGRDQTGQIDISEGPPGANGRIVRLTAAQFDPGGVLIPATARNANFLRVLQYQTRDDLNTDFDSLELSLERRYSDRWSGRVSYTLAYSNEVGTRYTNDLNPREDYGRSGSDNRHGFVTSANYDLWRGLGVGAIFKHYSGRPINETVGSDVNGDRDNNERPQRGVHDLTRPILSPLDANGRAVRNGIDGNSVDAARPPDAVHRGDAAAPDRRRVLGSVQRAEQGEFRQPDREPQQRELHDAGHGRDDAVDAARREIYVLSRVGTATWNVELAETSRASRLY